ncbi:MAG: TIGR03905 family TSCPD domain-containing protein [Candidatus Howiella sp.]
MKFTYKTKGTCSRSIEIEIEGNTLRNVWFEGGCSGNLQGISSLIKGQDVDWVIGRLDGIQCGMKPTSCPDQLARALREYKEEHMD